MSLARPPEEAQHRSAQREGTPVNLPRQTEAAGAAAEGDGMAVDRRLLLPSASGVLVLVLGLLLAAMAARWQQDHNGKFAQQRFDELAARVTDHLSERMRSYDKGLRGVRGAVVVNGGAALDRAQMHAYSATRDIDQEFPGARGFGIIWRVPQAQEQSFVARARANGWPDFKVRQFQPHGGERFVIELIEPLQRNREAVGLDIASEASRRRAALAAMHSGEATLSGPVRLVQASGVQAHGFVVVLPIYRPGLPLATLADREAATTGWSYAPLMIQEVLAGADRDGALYTLELRDQDAQDGGVFHDTATGAEVATDGPRQRVTMSLFGRTWHAELQATPAFVLSLDQRDPRGVGAAVATVAALAGALVALLGQALQRKRRMLLEVARRAAIVDSSDEAIIAGTLQGVITEWNAGAERLFGLTAAQALGRPSASLLLPPERQQEDADIRAVIARGERVMPVFTTRRHADGSLIDVSLTASPVFDSAGRCIGFAKIMRDIREARRAQLALAALNAQLEQQVADRTAKLDAARHTLQTVLDAMPSQIGYWDRDLRNQVANRAYKDWFGIDPAQLRGRHMRELLGPDMFDDNRERLAAALAGRPQSFQGRPIARPDGNGHRHGLVNYLPDIVDGEVRGIFTLVHDITELTEGRLALAAAQRAQTALLQTLDRHSIVSVADRRGQIISVNEAFCRISGFCEGELVGQNHRIVNSGLHERAFWVGMWRTLGAGESWRGEVCNRAKDGSLYWVDSVVAPFFDADGKVEKYVSIRTDITPIKRLQQEAETARREAERSSRFLREVLDASTQFSIIACGADGVVSVFNRGAERLLGHAAGDVVGRVNTLSFHFRQEVESRARVLSEQLGRPLESWEALVNDVALDAPQEWNYRRKDGSAVPVSLAVTAMRDENGVPAGYLGIAHDISSRLRHEERLRHAVHEARRANASKSSFLANMSHEIRTPMNAVIGLAYVLERTPLDVDQASTLAKIRLAGQALLAIINDVLDLSKFEAGEFGLERAPFHLPTLLREVTLMLSVQAEARGIELALELPEALPEALEGDATRLRQVLTNLLSNAIKFTERGSVRLQVQAVVDPQERAQLRFVVVDTGTGIDADALKRLFRPFVQADSSTTRRFGGTGLGLSIVKQLVEMMGGRVGVHSVPGQGSEFWVELCLPLADPARVLALALDDGLPGDGAHLQGLRVLVVDDSPLNLEVARRILMLEQAQVLLAANGQEAVDLLLADPAACDVVLMDVQMPVLDGLDATRRIRSALGLTRLPIIGLTAGVSSAESQRARGAGMNEVLGKPFDPAALVRCLLRHTGGGPVAPQVAAVAGPALALPAGWPVVAGIDSAEVTRRLRGDADLFRMLLRRTLADAEDLATGPDAAAAPLDAAAMQALAARLHQLKGGAGTLAAHHLAAVAGEAETAARAGTLAPALLHQLAQAVRALGDASAQVLAEPPSPAPAADAGPQARAEPPPDPQALAQLKEQLQRCDLAAMDGFKALKPFLRRQLGEAAVSTLQAQVDGLDFGAAARGLEAVAL